MELHVHLTCSCDGYSVDETEAPRTGSKAISEAFFVFVPYSEGHLVSSVWEIMMNRAYWWRFLGSSLALVDHVLRAFDQLQAQDGSQHGSKPTARLNHTAMLGENAVLEDVKQPLLLYTVDIQCTF